MSLTVFRKPHSTATSSPFSEVRGAARARLLLVIAISTLSATSALIVFALTVLSVQS